MMIVEQIMPFVSLSNVDGMKTTTQANMFVWYMKQTLVSAKDEIVAKTVLKLTGLIEDYRTSIVSRNQRQIQKPKEDW